MGRLICTSIAGLSPKRCMEVAASCEMAEIRLDSMKVSSVEVKEIFSSHPRLVATCRSGPHMDVNRCIELLDTAVRAGAAWVDLNLEWPHADKVHMVELSHENGCKVIVSHHDFERTPGRDELLRIHGKCLDSGADLVKIACMVNETRDGARLLGLLDKDSVLVVGMGQLGTITRLAAPLLGAPFTYASMGPGHETAPGQVDATILRQWIQDVEARAKERE